MRETIEEMRVLVECRVKLVTVGDTYSINNSIQTQAELITEENRQEKVALINAYTREKIDA